MTPRPSHGLRPLVRLTRLAKSRPRLWISLTAGLLAFSVLPATHALPTRLLLSWDGAVLLYLLLITVMVATSRPGHIRTKVARYDEGRVGILILTIGAVVASVGAIIAELTTAKSSGHVLLSHVGLAGATIALSFAFMHTMFALHYAHDFYSPSIGGGVARGLDFQMQEEPGFGDFLYFAFVIGCQTATADVNIQSREIRSVALVHGITSFAFNTAVVALTINIGASLLG